MKWSHTSLLVALLSQAPLAAQNTVRLSVTPQGGQATGGSSDPVVTPDGRFVAFDSWSTDFTPETTSLINVYLLDRHSGSFQLISRSLAGTGGNDRSHVVDISADGNFVLFRSRASDLVVGDTNGYEDVFVAEAATGVITRVNVTSGGIEANERTTASSISDDGRFVSFFSRATNLLPGDPGLATDVFVHDRTTGTLELVNVELGGTWPTTGISQQSDLSGDGRYVVFMSTTSTLVANDPDTGPDIFLRDRQLGTTQLISVHADNTHINGSMYTPRISSDARWVVFHTSAPMFAVENGYVDGCAQGRAHGQHDGDLARHGLSERCGELALGPRQDLEQRPLDHFPHVGVGHPFRPIPTIPTTWCATTASRARSSP